MYPSLVVTAAVQGEHWTMRIPLCNSGGTSLPRERKYQLIRGLEPVLIEVNFHRKAHANEASDAIALQHCFHQVF